MIGVYATIEDTGTTGDMLVIETTDLDSQDSSSNPFEVVLTAQITYTDLNGDDQNFEVTSTFYVEFYHDCNTARTFSDPVFYTDDGSSNWNDYSSQLTVQEGTITTVKFYDVIDPYAAEVDVPDICGERDF